MKKALAFLLLICAFLVVGCDKPAEVPTKTDENATQAPPEGPRGGGSQGAAEAQLNITNEQAEAHIGSKLDKK